MPGRKRKAASKTAAVKDAPPEDVKTSNSSNKRPKKGTATQGSSKLTVDAIVSDTLTPLANKYWAPQTGDAEDTRKPFDAEIVEVVYQNELRGKPVPNARATMLDVSNYLENYLWPNFDGDSSSFAHVMSIILMVNEKFRNNDLNVWATAVFPAEQAACDAFFQRCIALQSQSAADDIFGKAKSGKKGKKGKKGEQGTEMSLAEKNAYLQFFINCFQSLEHPHVASTARALAGRSLFGVIGNRHVVDIFQQRVPAHLEEQSTQASSPEAASFLTSLLAEFLQTLASLDQTLSTVTNGKVEDADVIAQIRCCERLVEFVTDLCSHRDSRAFVSALVQDVQFAALCAVSRLHAVSAGSEEQSAVSPLFSQLSARLDEVLELEAESATGRLQLLKEYHEGMEAFQRVCYEQFPERLRTLALAHCSRLENAEVLAEDLSGLSVEELHALVVALELLPSNEESKTSNGNSFVAELMASGLVSSREFLYEVLTRRCRRPVLQLERARSMPVYPTEEVLFDALRSISSATDGARSLALPKVNLQFLSMHDYLLRNFELYRLESAYDIRLDVVKTIKKLNPGLNAGQTVFLGHSNMALPMEEFSVSEVKASHVGQTKPGVVRAVVAVDLARFHGAVRKDWENLERHDVVFLLDVRGGAKPGEEGESVEVSKEALGVRAVRGCEIEQVVDGTGKVVHERDGKTGEVYKGVGSTRKFHVLLDTAQYESDMLATFERDAPNVYTSMNVLMRRHGRANNFKSVLESVRDLMEAHVVLPSWLQDRFLFAGNQNDEQSTQQRQEQQNDEDAIEVFETFVSEEHLKSALPDNAVIEWEGSRPRGPSTFSVTLCETEGKSSKKTSKKKSADIKGAGMVISATARWHRSPIAADVKRNSVPFTQTQVEAISRGLRRGLTMIVGPPGTGKTDVAVQMITELYHAHPTQRILVVTHGNQALNDVFEKLLERDIPQGYLVRLGRGSEMLDTKFDYSRSGRVAHILQRRLDLLKEVSLISTQTQVALDAQYTCDSANAFFLQHALRLWEEFTLRVQQEPSASIQELFPFTAFFANKVPGGKLFENDREGDVVLAEYYWTNIKSIFEELREIQPFELLHGHRDRGDYVVAKYARVIAMTCTHAAIKRKQLLAMGFSFDSVIMEESAQMLDVETLMPLTLQRQAVDQAQRLQRVVLIGDHYQLPPVVKNASVRNFSRFDQSLFARFVRAGTVPVLTLDAQGRSRPELAALWNWRYNGLTDLPTIATHPRYQQVNAGFAHTHQMIHVGPLNGVGESEPASFFFQNLAEAEYIVQTFMYMRRCGYPAHQIAILTTYNGQKALIEDVLQARCANEPKYGLPGRVQTVDQFQGQQADYVLLSLVRTKSVGHLRDIRRLVVAMSRARMGLYVFCNADLFLNCYELSRTFGQLARKPRQLALLPNESAHKLSKRKLEDVVQGRLVADVMEMANLVSQLS